MKKRVAALALGFAVLLTVTLLSGRAAEVDYVAKGQQVATAADKIVFPTDGSSATAVCPVCGTSASWIPLGEEEVAGNITLEAGKHYYLTESVTADKACISSPQSKVACLHLNGKDVTSNTTQALYGSSGVLNVMGKGNVTGGAANTGVGATLQINTSGADGMVNLYGGTYRKLDSASNSSVIGINTNGGKISIYAGAKVIAGSTGSALYINGEMNYTSAVINLYGGEIDGNGSAASAVYVEAADTLMSTSGTPKPVEILFNMHGGTVKNGCGASGGNVFVGKNGVFTMIGGKIADGKATHGGNVYVEGTCNMSGGEITGSRDAEGTALGGVATGNGGNIYVKSGAVLNITGGELEKGSANYGGNLLIAGTANLQNVTITDGISKSHGGNVSVENGKLTIGGDTRILNGYGLRGGNLRIYQGVVVMNDGYIAGGATEATDGLHNVWVAASSTKKAQFYFMGGTIEATDQKNNTGIMASDYCEIYLAGSATVTDPNENFAAVYLKATSKLFVCNGWSGSADVYFPTGYAVGTSLPENIAQVVTLGNDLNVRRIGGNFSGILLQRGTVTNGLCAGENGALVAAGAVLVDDKGNRSVAEDPLAAWNAKKYSYIMLYSDTAFADCGGKIIRVDLNGFDLTAGGAGTVEAFDSQNDDYDAAACGVLTAADSVEVLRDVFAPNGNRYIAVPNGNGMTFHRLDAYVSAVVLQPSIAGLYYQAVYQCDTVLRAAVKSYGVALSVEDMPGADFISDGDEYTVATAPFESGVSVNSGAVSGILKALGTDGRTVEENEQFSQMVIYANPYLCLDLGEDVYVVGDGENAGRSVADRSFTGIVHSLRDVLQLLDNLYYTYSVDARRQLDDFYGAWKDKGLSWQPESIGTGVYIDNSDLVFAPGTTDALCPVCQKTVTWTALSADKMIVLPNGGHYYLAKDLVHTGKDTTFVYAPQTSGYKACLHLNGHNLTATNTKAIYGSGGVLNVMGNGIVSGYNTTANMGAAVQINNGWPTATLNLYGGTYIRGNSPATSSVVALWNVGGTINLYPGATVDTLEGNAIYVSYASHQDGRLNLLGGNVTGGAITMRGADPSYGHETILRISGGDIQATIDVAANNRVILSGAPQIKALAPDETVRLDVQGLKEGARVGIDTVGRFTQHLSYPGLYQTYFVPLEEGYEILSRGNTLACGKDYAQELVFDSNRQAVCPVCEKLVSWTAVTAEAPGPLADGGHYYLTQDVLWEGSTNFIAAPELRDTEACLHLNGCDLTATATQPIYGSGGVLNVMGSGTVTGTTTTASHGAAVQINTNSPSGAVNLYSGTYAQSEDTGANSYTLAVAGNGGAINLYDDAQITAKVTGKAIYSGAATRANGTVGLYGATVDGNVYIAGADQTAGFTSSVVVKDATVTGTMDINGVNKVTFSGAPSVKLLDLEHPGRLQLENMAVGTDVTVIAQGRFTETNADVATYQTWFKAYNRQGSITVSDNQLVCSVDYTAALQFTKGNVAYCPACQKDVTWKQLTAEKLSAKNGDHYYLANSVTYTGDGENVYGFIGAPGTQDHRACIHLNGYDLTSTKLITFYGSGGVLNVMGNGNVTGCSAKLGTGAAVQINNGWPRATINLYGGAYRVGSGSVSDAAPIAIWHNGGSIKVYRSATLYGTNGNGAYVGTANINNATLGIYGARVEGGIYLAGANQSKGYASNITIEDATITGTVDTKLYNNLRLMGRSNIGKLKLAEGVKIQPVNMLSGSSVCVSATGAFTDVLEDVAYADYFTTKDAGQWVVIRQDALHQRALLDAEASDEDVAMLNTTYAGTTLRYGEMHNHTNSGPYKGYSTGADGKKSLEEWIAEMDRLKLDFAFIVDHGMSIHMYFDQFRPDYFIGGTEPGTTITDSKASPKSPHYNMLFAYPEQLESIFFKWEEKYVPIKWDGYEDGWRVKYPSFTTAEFGQLAKDVYDAGGLLVQVHPKYDSYIYSDDPMDYYFADYTGFEILTGNGNGGKYNMMYKDNAEAYETWVEMLEMGKKVWATAGSDGHNLPDISGLTVMYTVRDHKDDYMAAVRAGNMAPGWVGIRMNVNGTAMGGETSFVGQRLQFSVGDIYNTGVKDYGNTPAPYVEGHTYRMELYDQDGVVLEAVIDPTEMNYFAIDCDESAMFYRVVVWDDTDNERIGVGNPIWNTK